LLCRTCRSDLATKISYDESGMPVIIRTFGTNLIGTSSKKIDATHFKNTADYTLTRGMISSDN